MTHLSVLYSREEAHAQASWYCPQSVGGFGGRGFALGGDQEGEGALPSYPGKMAVGGLMAWRAVALGIRRAGIPIQSGNVPVERLWSILESMMPPAGRTVSPRWFNVLAMLMYVRFNFGHFKDRSTAGKFARGDPLLQQRLETFLSLVHTVTEDASTDHLQPLFEPFELGL